MSLIRRASGRRNGRPLVLYHGTSMAHWEDISRRGLCAPNWLYLTDSPAVAEYYAEEATEEDGEDYLFLRVEIPDHLRGALEPDYPGIEEPLTFALRTTESAVRAAWEGSSQTWEDSLRIIRSARLRLGGGCFPAVRVAVIPWGRQ